VRLHSWRVWRVLLTHPVHAVIHSRRIVRTDVGMVCACVNRFTGVIAHGMFRPAFDGAGIHPVESGELLLAIVTADTAEQAMAVLRAHEENEQ
jgi:hypothetical protein